MLPFSVCVVACSCICHTCFTLHRRHYDEDTLKELLRRVSAAAAGSKPLPFEEFTKARLLCAADRKVAGLAAKRILLAEHPRNREQSSTHMADGSNHVSEVLGAIAIASSSRTVSNQTTGAGLESQDNFEDDRKMPAAEIALSPAAPNVARNEDEAVV